MSESIPISDLVSISPRVLSATQRGIVLNGLFLTSTKLDDVTDPVPDKRLIEQESESSPILVGKNTGGNFVDFTGMDGKRTLIGVSDGSAGSDAVNLDQMNNAIQAQSRVLGDSVINALGTGEIETNEIGNVSIVNTEFSSPSAGSGTFSTVKSTFANIGISSDCFSLVQEDPRVLGEKCEALLDENDPLYIALIGRGCRPDVVRENIGCSVSEEVSTSTESTPDSSAMPPSSTESVVDSTDKTEEPTAEQSPNVDAAPEESSKTSTPATEVATPQDTTTEPEISPEEDDLSGQGTSTETGAKNAV